jgi:hypothetical protein
MADEVVSGGQQIASEATLQRLLDTVAGSGDSSAALKLRQLADASGKAGKTTKEVDERFQALAANLTKFANALLDGNATTSQLVGSFSALKGTTGLVATAFSKLLSIQEANFAEYQKITSAGANFSGSLTDLRTAAMKSYMTLDQFGSLIKTNTNDLITLGGNVNSGAKAFAQFSNSILSSQAGTNIMALGYTTEGANQAMLTYLGSMGVNNLEQLKSDKNLRASTESYLEELDRLSQVTGKSREELNEKMKKEKMDADIRMTAARMDPKQREAFLANVRYMTTQYGDAGKDMALAQAQGRAVRTKEGQMLSAVAPKMQAAYAEMDKAAKQYGVGSKEYIAAQNQVSLAAQEGLGRIPTAVLSANDAFKGLETAVGTTADQQLAGLTTKEKFDARDKAIEEATAKRKASQASDMAEASKGLKELGAAVMELLSPFVSLAGFLAKWIGTVAGWIGSTISLFTGLTAKMGAFGTIIQGVVTATIAYLVYKKLENSAMIKSATGGVLGGIKGILPGGGGGVPTPPGAGALAGAGGAVGGGGGGFIGFIKALGRGLASLAPIAVPMLIGAGAVAGVIALLGAGLAAAIALIGLSLPVFAKGLKDIAEIDGLNLLTVAAGITALGFAMVAFTASSVVSGLGAIGAKVLNFFSGGGPIGLIKDSINELSPILPQLLALGPALQTFSTSLNAGFSGIDTAQLKSLASGISELGLSLVAFSGATVAAGLAGAGSQIINFFTGGGPIAQIKTTVAELSPLIPSMQALGPALSNYSSAIVSFGKAVSGVDIAKAEKLKEAMKGPGLAESISSAAGKMVSATANLVTGQQGSEEKTSLALTTLNNTINDLKVIMREVAENTKNNVNATKKLNGNLFA